MQRQEPGFHELSGQNRTFWVLGHAFDAERMRRHLDTVPGTPMFSSLLRESRVDGLSPQALAELFVEQRFSGAVQEKVFLDPRFEDAFMEGVAPECRVRGLVPPVSASGFAMPHGYGEALDYALRNPRALAPGTRSGLLFQGVMHRVLATPDRRQNVRMVALSAGLASVAGASIAALGAVTGGAAPAVLALGVFLTGSAASSLLMWREARRLDYVRHLRRRGARMASALHADTPALRLHRLVERVSAVASQARGLPRGVDPFTPPVKGVRRPGAERPLARSRPSVQRS